MTESSCLRRKSPFDVSISICEWIESNKDESNGESNYTCHYVRPTLSVQVFIYLFNSFINLLFY